MDGREDVPRARAPRRGLDVPRRHLLRLHPAVVVHYHEVSLKRGNRPLFLRHLARNVERAIADLPPARVHQLPGRIMIDLEGNPAPETVRDRVARVCGIASLALAYRVPSTVEAMKAVIAQLVEGRQFPSFRISARRAFKSYPMTSVELNRELGAFVLERVPTRVDLHAPAFTIHVEVLPAETFVYTDVVQGPGGLPVGASGTVMALLSGGIDSPVAAWRMMKRGCRVVFVHFHSVPYLPPTSQEKARALVGRLTQWQYRSQLFLVPLGEVQREVVLTVPPPTRVVVYRRMMIRIAEALAKQTGALALTTGESLGQVASQTLTNISRTDEVAELPVLRPLIGMDKLEITAEAQRLDTFEISIEPDADCCTLFVPKHPSTRVSRDEIHRVESGLDLPRLIGMALDGTRLETFAFPAVVTADLPA
ncbi:MAG: tRNA 4-thiouridine(8) synthase ThiI [Candidatus Rokubacteria bacterium]|nr:tRNA 4-thiouridine(8) synthase ThiI [Candidatus Rokubacteria bacterium]